MDEVERRRVDVQSLALNLERLATIVEMGEKQRTADMITIREKLSEKNEDYRIMKHDIANIAQGMQAIPLMGDRITENSKMLSSHDSKIDGIGTRLDRVEGAADSALKIAANHEAKIEALNTWKSEIAGASGAYKRTAGIIWALLGSAGGVFLTIFLWWLDHRTGGVISGE